MTENERLAMDRLAATFRRIERAFDAFSDQVELLTDSLIRYDRHEWEFPDLLLRDEEREAIYARQMGRTLEDIDSLPTSRRA